MPFFLRAGKAMATRTTEVRVIFRVLQRTAPYARIETSAPTSGVSLDLLFSEQPGELPTPYERLLTDAMRGDSRLFTREDSDEETWRIVQPLLDAPPPLAPYAVGSMGPAEADRSVAGHVAWQQPWRSSR